MGLLFCSRLSFFAVNILKVVFKKRIRVIKEFNKVGNTWMSRIRRIVMRWASLIVAPHKNIAKTHRTIGAHHL